ncbi:hypothetical protein AX16_006631 [Volvariella volvacea WC 439]|nr:hypothetical protein AX16_006631 [Volvariella volvacea WC 439]
MQTRHESLDTCPADVIYSIIPYVGFDTLLNLRLTSRTLHSTVTPIALRGISPLSSVSQGSTTTKSLDDIASCLSTCNFGVSSCSRDAAQRQILPTPRLTNIYTHAQHLTLFVDTAEVYEILNRSNLPAVIGTLRRLRALKSLLLMWLLPEDRLRGSNPFILDLQEVMCRAVLAATSGRLEELIITPEISDFRLDLSGNAALRSKFNITQGIFPHFLLPVRGLKLFEFALDPQGMMCPSKRSESTTREFDHGARSNGNSSGCCIPKVVVVCRVVTMNHGIEELILECGCAHSNFTLESMEISGHTLQRFVFRGVRFPRVLEDSSHFRKMTWLSISPAASSDTDIDNLWLTLRKVDPQPLTTLQPPRVTRSFLEFLASFTGLETLVIYALDPENESLVELGQDFFLKALPNHAPTLQELRITFAEEVYEVPEWTYTPSYLIPNFSRMSSLQYLTLHPSEITGFDASFDEVLSAYQAILDGIDDSCSINHTEFIPESSGILCSLECLEIPWALGVLSCGGEFAKQITERVEATVCHLRSRHGVPAELRLCTGTYGSKQLDDGLWGYELL